MKFGFLFDAGEIYPEIFLSIDRIKRAKIFINLYNSCVEDDLKIPLKYANLNLKIGDIFTKRVDDLLKFDRIFANKISSFCISSNIIIKSYQDGGVGKVPVLASCVRHKAAKLINLLKSQNGVCFDADTMFFQFVYDKIRRKHFDKNVYFQDGIIFAESDGRRLFAVMPCFKEITKERFHLADCEIAKGFKLLGDGAVEKMFIVAPRNAKFSRYIEVKDGCAYATSLRLVPYTISHHIF